MICDVIPRDIIWTCGGLAIESLINWALILIRVITVGAGLNLISAAERIARDRRFLGGEILINWTIGGW